MRPRQAGGPNTTLQYELDLVDGALGALYSLAGAISFGIVTGSPGLLGLNWSLDALLVGGSGWAISWAMAINVAVFLGVFATNRLNYTGRKDWWGMNQTELVAVAGTAAILIGSMFFAPLVNMLGSNVIASYGAYLLSIAGLYAAGWAA